MTVGWLRVQPGSAGYGERAVLFETDGDGRPLRLRIASSPGAGVGAARTTVAPLGDDGSHAPGFVVAVAGEPPDDAALGVPVWRVPLPETNGGASWKPARADPPSATIGPLLDSALQARAEEFLARVATAARVAFDDRRLQAMMQLAGFSMALTLSLTETPNRDAIDLASRLRQILCPSADDVAADADDPDGDPLSWPAPLMPFQREGVRVLLDMPRLLLADDMGLGKTVQAIAALRIRKARGALGPVLVVAPASVLDQWRGELAKWAPELTAIVVRGAAAERVWKWRAGTDVTLTSYGVLRADAWRAEVGGRRWDTVVADEAQRIKNRVETSDAVKGLGRSRSWALSGTPVENREDELASILEFVDHDGSRPLKRYAPGEALLTRHRALQLRRRKADVLKDLPPKLVTNRTIELPAGQRASYDRAEREGVVYLRSLGADVTIVHVLELITRLKQICNADPKTGASCKLDNIAARLAELTGQGHKAVVFSQYTSANAGVRLAARRLAEFAPVELTGDVPGPERPALIDTFRNAPEHRVLIASLGVGGVGLNLQEASYVFHLDRWWNPAVERQAEDRVHRLGQQVKVHVVKYTCADTIEQRIERILADKQALFDELVDDVSLDLAARLSREELLALFEL